MFQTFFIHSAVSGILDTKKTLGNSGTTRAYGHLGTPRTKRHSRHLDTWALEGHLDIRALKALGHLGTQTLGHLGNCRPVVYSGT